MLTSIQNPQVKKWRKLHQRKYRKQLQQFIVEGSHLVEEALKSNWRLECIIIREGEKLPLHLGDIEVQLVTEKVFHHLSQTESPQGIAAIVHMPEEKTMKTGNVLLIDAVQDPGNVGTMIRTADAAGFSGVVLGTGTVDPYNEKVIRATQGSLFHLPIVEANLHTTISALKIENYTVWASALSNAISLDTATFAGKTALIVGNEGSGISTDVLQMADQCVKIPIHGKAESLNVSVAAGILMYRMNGK